MTSENVRQDFVLGGERRTFVQSLLGEHLLQTLQDRENSPSLELAERFEQTLGVNRPQLIQRDKARAALKPAARTPRVRAFTSCHGRHDDGAEVIVQFVRRDDYAWS